MPRFVRPSIIPVQRQGAFDFSFLLPAFESLISPYDIPNHAEPWEQRVRVLAGLSKSLCPRWKRFLRRGDDVIHKHYVGVPCCDRDVTHACTEEINSSVAHARYSL